MLKLNVGFNRKTGEANYGSRGASVNLELELDSGLVEQPDRLQDRIRQLFALARSSVESELQSSTRQSNGDDHDRRNGNGNGTSCQNHAGSNGHSSRSREGTVRRATQSQVRAIHAIAGRFGVDLGERLQADFGLQAVQQLSIGQASQLIDRLKGAGHPQPEMSGGDR